MSRWGMVIDLDACTGCGACTVACRMENNVPATDESAFVESRALDWIRIATQVDGASYETLLAQQYPLFCQHCDDAPCTKVCPVGATYKDEEGTIGQIYARCIGCRYCTVACPYDAKTFNWFDPKWPEGAEQRLNPDVSIRERGVVEKCTFCHHRRQKAEDTARAAGRAMAPADYVPACVQICPAGAMHFGDLDDQNSKVSELAQNPRAEKLLAHEGTEPKVVYLRRSRTRG